MAGLTEIWVISEDLKVATGGKGNIAGHITGIDPYSWVVDSSDRFLFGGSDGHVYQMDHGSDDNGTAISIEISKTGINFGNPSIYKKPKEFEAVVETTANCKINCSYDYGIFGSVGYNDLIDVTVRVGGLWDVDLWDVALWDATGQNLIRSRNLLGRGKFMNLKLTHAMKGAIIKIPYFILRYQNMGVD
jgi:hypothetical protein